MLKFIIIGLVCNSQECYWVQADNKNPATYEDYQPCKGKADELRRNSIMYFATDCMVYNKEEK